MNKIIYSVDVEYDLHDNGERGIKQGLLELERLCEKHHVKPALFVVAGLIENNKTLFKRLHKKGWDISLHGFSHRRFDDLNLKEKEEEIIKSLREFKKIGIKPKGFRAPQHSIDEKTLDLLEEYGFEYDSSYTPFNALQLLFFPSRLINTLKGFFSKPNPYRIRDNLLELPVSSIIIPPVSLTIRVLPLSLLKIYFRLLNILYKRPVFYAHSWDFIELKESRIDRLFNHNKFIYKLGQVMRNENT